jgi:hypothetical protein
MLAGYVGMKGTNIVVFCLSILFWLLTGAAAYFVSPWLLLLAGVPWFVSLIAYIYLAGIASRVYLCALYLYASEGAVPAPYDASMMSAGWKLKKGAISA